MNMSNRKLPINFFKNKFKIPQCSVSNEDNIQNKLDEINLNKIQKVSKVRYNDNIKNNMIEYIKKNDNSYVEYINWVKQFNEQDYINEFVDKIRDNEIYHEIWVSLNKPDGGFEIIY